MIKTLDLQENLDRRDKKAMQIRKIRDGKMEGLDLESFLMG